jgi:2'-5' RNA ligase
MNTLRTFIAIELDQTVKDELMRIQDRLMDQVAPRTVRWVRPEGIHLTLKFLGDTPVAQIAAVQEALARAAQEARPFTIALAGTGCFPDARRPQVVWVGIHEPTGALARLRDAVEAEVAPLGFPTERRAFRPHLTLGRVSRDALSSEVRRIGAAAAGGDLGVTGEMTAQAVSYIKSDLRPGGAIYTTLFEAGFLGG